MYSNTATCLNKKYVISISDTLYFKNIHSIFTLLKMEVYITHMTIFLYLLVRLFVVFLSIKN